MAFTALFLYQTKFRILNRNKTEIAMKTKIFLVASLIALLAIGCVNPIKKAPKQEVKSVEKIKVNWSLETYSINGGWGYIIYRDGKKMINQDQIPAISGKYAFGSENLAKKTAALVVKKLNDNKLPTITKQELIELGVVDSLLVPQK